MHFCTGQRSTLSSPDSGSLLFIFSYYQTHPGGQRGHHLTVFFQSENCEVYLWFFFCSFLLSFLFLGVGGGICQLKRKILKPHIKACLIAKLYQTTHFLSQILQKKKAQVNKQTKPLQLQSSERIQNSRTHSRQPQLSVLGFSFLPVTQDDEFKSDLPVFTQQVGITGSFRKRRATPWPHSSHSAPLLSLPRQMHQLSTRSQMLFPVPMVQKAFPTRYRPASLAPTGVCARQPFPNPSCCSTGSCQSSLCPGQGCLLPTVFTPRAASTLSVTFKGSAWGQAGHSKSSCACCLLLPSDKAFCSNTAASETAAYKYSCLLKATSSGWICK